MTLFRDGKRSVPLRDEPWKMGEPKPRKVGRKRRRAQNFLESSGKEVRDGLWCSACGTPAVEGEGSAECPKGCGDFTGCYFVSGEGQAASIRGEGLPRMSPAKER